jgi:hypothetical protein
MAYDPRGERDHGGQGRGGGGRDGGGGGGYEGMTFRGRGKRESNVWKRGPVPSSEGQFREDRFQRDLVSWDQVVLVIYLPGNAL